MATEDHLDVTMRDLSISKEEDEELVFDEEAGDGVNRFELCLVGKFLTEKNLNVRAMKSKMADIWRPAMGINIKMLTPGLFLFQFYHKDDMKWMMNNGPWSFDNAMLITSVIPTGEDPTKVPLNEVEFWIQIYDLPPGFMAESIGKQLGNFFGSFVSYDSSNNTSIWREYMRLRIKVDIRVPLKRKKKICGKSRKECAVNCKYEKLGDFCFVCGLLTHTERFCKKKLEGTSNEVLREWGSWLRAPPRRGAAQGRSKWLREENSEEWGGNLGMDKDHGFQNLNVARSAGNEREKGKGVITNTSNQGFANNEISMATEGAGKNNSNCMDGPGLDEMDGLDLEERKRKKVGLNETMDLDKNFGIAKSGSELSNVDCTGPSSFVLATVAQQASQEK